MHGLVPLSTPVPIPVEWARMHCLLAEAWKVKADPAIPQPPTPLILSGAAFSKASDIRRRWAEFIEWANSYGHSAVLFAALPSPPHEDVAQQIAGVGENSLRWWPTFGEQFHQPKDKPSRELVKTTFQKLHDCWPKVAGPELAAHTKPLYFTGHKSRRLVVAANPNILPPWGSWYFASSNLRSFTTFRKGANSVIAPMEVDVIDFLPERWNQSVRIPRLRDR